MHFDEEILQLAKRNTKIQEAPKTRIEGPRNITAKRRIIKFNRDFISHNGAVCLQATRFSITSTTIDFTVLGAMTFFIYR